MKKNENEEIWRSEKRIKNYDFKGKLSYTWPSSVPKKSTIDNQIVHYPMFDYGFGLNYKSKYE